MYNSKVPTDRELPSSRQLFKSTIYAAVTAAFLLITIVLPAEYGIDPTGAGQLTGLTEKGRIKVQLEEEAAIESKVKNNVSSGSETELRLKKIDESLNEIVQLLKDGTAINQSRQQVVSRQKNIEKKQTAESTNETSDWKDHISITLKPGQGVEYKLVMDKGAKAWFEWTANGSKLNFDAHGYGGGQSVQYKKGRGVPNDAGMFEAPFKGNHGWFWRNRTDKNVTLTLKTKGDYIKLKRTA